MKIFLGLFHAKKKKKTATKRQKKNAKQIFSQPLRSCLTQKIKTKTRKIIKD